MFHTVVQTYVEHLAYQLWDSDEKGSRSSSSSSMAYKNTKAQSIVPTCPKHKSLPMTPFQDASAGSLAAGQQSWKACRKNAGKVDQTHGIS